MFFIQIFTQPTSMHQKSIEYEKYYMESNQILTKKSCELTPNSPLPIFS